MRKHCRYAGIFKPKKTMAPLVGLLLANLKFLLTQEPKPPSRARQTSKPNHTRPPLPAHPLLALHLIDLCTTLRSPPCT